MSKSSTSSSHPSLPNAKYWEEDDVTQECKQLLSSLPRQKGWIFSNYYQYQGFWLPSGHVQGVLTFQNQFQANDKDILLITTPKCGTTWLKALLFAVVNRAKMAPNGQDHPLMSSNPHVVVPFLEFDTYFDDLAIPNLSKLPSPRIFATHVPAGSLLGSIRETGCKIVYLCRDPKDAFISLWHFCNNLVPKGQERLKLEEAYAKFCNGVSLFGPFWDHVLGYWNYGLDKPHKVLFLKFEDLKKQPNLELVKLAKFCGCPFSLEEENEGVIEQIIELCSFGKLSNLEVNNVGKLASGVDHKVFFRKGDVGDWVNYLTPQMVEQFDRITRDLLGSLGLEF